MAEAHSAAVHVQVVYAEPGSVFMRDLCLPPGSTVEQAVAASGLRRERPWVVLSPDCLGVFGHRVEPGQALRDGDRVEVYRPLQRDPMQARRQRAASSAKR